MMGVDWADCGIVAEIVGVKFFTNEFVAYQQLSQYKNKRLSGVEEWLEGEKQWVSVSDNPEKHTQLGLSALVFGGSDHVMQTLAVERQCFLVVQA